MEYEDQQLEDLLALEKPKKKKYNNFKEKDLSQVICYTCRHPGHYANECPEKKNKGIATRGYVANKEHRKDLSHVTCFGCKEEGHYRSECPERKLQKTKGKVLITKKRGPKAKVAAKKETTPRSDPEGTRDMSKVFCHHCRKTGHFADNCQH